MGITGRPLAWRIPVGVLLVAGTLFYLQFALFALANSLLQAALTLLAVGSLAVGAYRAFVGQWTALIILTGTLPLLVFHVVATLVYPDESPAFIVLFGVAPLVAITAWLLGSRGTRQEA